MNAYLLRVLICLVGWRIAWLVIYWTTGLYVGYLSINNGISANNVEFNRGIRIYASSVRLRLWGNTRKLVITDLNIVLRPRQHPARRKEPSTPVSDAQLSVYTLSLVKNLCVKLILYLLKSVDIEFKETKLNHEKFSAEAKSISFLIGSHFSVDKPQVQDIQLSISILQANSKLKILSTSHDLLRIGTSTISLSLSIDRVTGLVSDVSTRVYVDEVDLNVFQIIKSKVLSMENNEQEGTQCKKSGPKSDINAMRNLHKKLSPCFKECSINIAYFSTRGIPLFPASPDCSISEYFNSVTASETLYTSVDTASIHLERILPTSAGYDIHFNSVKDLPLHVTFSSSLVKAGFETNKAKQASSICLSNKSEFLSIPNLSFTFKTNAARYLLNGLGFKNCLLEFFSSGNSPMLDFDHHQLAILAYNYTVWRKMLIGRKLSKMSKDSEGGKLPLSTDSDDNNDEEVTVAEDNNLKSSSIKPELRKTNKSGKNSMFDKAVSLLKEYYPQIDVKLTVEQPRLLIRVHKPHEEKVQMIMLSYSLMILHVMTTDDQDYDAECQFMHPNVTFSEKSDSDSFDGILNEEVCGLTDAKLNLHVFKDLKLETTVRMNGAFINLTKPDVLNGIHDIINETTTIVTRNSKVGIINLAYDKKILKARELNSPEYQKLPNDSTSNFFKPLPSWFISFNLKFENIQLRFGSASPLLPPNYISELSEHAKQRFVETEGRLNLDIATLTVSIQDSNYSEQGYAPSTISSSHASSSSETLAADSSVDVHWFITSQVESLKLSFSNESKHSSIVSIPSISHKLTSISENSKNRLLQENEIKHMQMNIDRQRLFVLFGSAYLITQTIVMPLKKLLNRLQKNTQTLKPASKPASKPSTSKHLSDCLTSAMKIEKIDLILAFSNDFKTRLQNYNLDIQFDEGFISVSNHFLRGMVISSTLAHHWDRVLCVDSLRVKIGDPAESQLVTLETNSIRFIQPHGFVVYKLFDNLSVFVKVSKHLASCFHSEEKETVVLPKVSKPVLSPGIKLRTGKLSFTIEDDPFDSELNMIYQLGLVEQRKRLEHLSIFDQKIKEAHSEDGNFDAELESLYKYFERSWVRKVGVYKEGLEKEIEQNKQFLFGCETDIPEFEYDRLKAYSIHAPLVSVSLMGVDLDIMKPRFELDELPEFIHRYGQGVPTETKYNLMIPTYMDLKVSELRMHMRDYPLPLFHLPYAKDDKGIGRALNMSGHLIICESLVLDKEHLRELKVQLTDATNKSSLQPNAFDKLVIQKSLSTVKLYTDMNVLFDSDLPSRFVWGQSYQFGIQQIMLRVDQFSKPPVDPSTKLGFWDKLRLIIHGKFSIETGKTSSIEVAFKGGKDPYDLFGKSNGFILSFKDSAVWKINEHDDSSRLFEIRSEKLSWYIPNYLANPLVCWTRESSKSAYLPADKDFINSCFGYYLGGNSSPPNAEELNICEKNVVELSGGIEFTVGFLLERFDKNKKELTTTCKPHYEIELFNPEFTEENHDSYKGFRSDRLHMAISLKAHSSDSYNTIHLSPGVFKQFFSWWKMFQGNILLPVRKGKLFQEIKGSQKFSSHLFTNKFYFDIGNLFISHIFQKEDSDSTSDDCECVGLRAKVDEFLVDLHQQKEEVVDIHEDLARHKKVMKMRFNLGQVLLNKIDLRTVEARFHRDLYNMKRQEPYKPPKNFLKNFDNDKEWFDMRDYEECFCPFTGDVKSAKIYPFLYSETFAYVRDTTNDKGVSDSSAERMHSCILSKTEYQSSEIKLYERRLKELKKISSKEAVGSGDSIAKRVQVLEKLISTCKSERKEFTRQGSYVSLERQEKENFHNRFLLVSMFLKWNEPVRNQFMKYIYFVKLSSIHKKFLSFEFMNILDGIIKRQDDLNDDSSLSTSSFIDTASRTRNLTGDLNKTQSSQERFDGFNEIIRSVNESQEILENYKIEIISPQIQLHSDELKKSVVMITAPSLESKIVSVVVNKDAQYQNNSNILEKRYGVILQDASVMVIDEDDVKKKSFAFEMSPYGTKTSWPPFLGIETCKNHELASRENVLVEKMSLMLTFNQMVASSSNIEQIEDSDETEGHHNLGSSTNGADKLRIDVPKIAINCTSKQYFTLYATIFSLMLYVEPMAADLREKMRKLNFSIDFQDFRALRERLMLLYEYVRITNELLKNYNFRQNGHLDNEDLNDYLLLENKKACLETEIVLMQQTLFSGDIVMVSTSHVIQDWLIAADKIVLHMLNDDRSYIIDLNIDHGVYKRTVKDDGSNDNQVQIMSIEGHSHLPNSHFEKFLEPIESSHKDHLIQVDWSMNRSIGGIKIIDNFDIKSLPLNVRIDEETGRSLMEFIFRQSEAEDLNKSPVLKIADQAQEESDNDTEQSADEYDDEDNEEADQSNSSVNSNRRLESKSENQEPSLATSSKMDVEEDVKSMISRSKKYLSIAKMNSQSFEVLISLRMKNGIKKWLNVTNFLLVLPQWKIERKILSLLEVVDYFKAVVIKALMGHSGSILKNKLTSRQKNLRRYIRRTGLNSSRLSLKSLDEEKQENSSMDPRLTEHGHASTRNSLG